MSICATINEFNQVIANATPIAECTGFILQDSVDYLANSFFQIPDSDTLKGFWFAGFVLPMTAHMVAWAAGSLANFFNKDHH
jgi:hypothetical protein